mgnify:CR=1 FL=1
MIISGGEVATVDVRPAKIVVKSFDRIEISFKNFFSDFISGFVKSYGNGLGDRSAKSFDLLVFNVGEYIDNFVFDAVFVYRKMNRLFTSEFVLCFPKT